MPKATRKKSSPATRQKIIAVRFGPKDLAAFQQFAAENRWPLSTAAWLIITDFLKEKGLLD
jgi:hypothetical protein